MSQSTRLDPKSTWPVVKFLIAATGFRRKEARALLEQIPHEKYADLFLRAMTWDRDTDGAASRGLEQLLTGAQVGLLAHATTQAQLSSTQQEEEEDAPLRAPRSMRRH